MLGVCWCTFITHVHVRVPITLLRFRLQQAFNGYTVVMKCIKMTTYDSREIYGAGFVLSKQLALNTKPLFLCTRDFDSDSRGLGCFFVRISRAKNQNYIKTLWKAYFMCETRDQWPWILSGDGFNECYARCYVQ